MSLFGGKRRTLGFLVALTFSCLLVSCMGVGTSQFYTSLDLAFPPTLSCDPIEQVISLKNNSKEEMIIQGSSVLSATDPNGFFSLQSIKVGDVVTESTYGKLSNIHVGPGETYSFNIHFTQPPYNARGRGKNDYSAVLETAYLNPEGISQIVLTGHAVPVGLSCDDEEGDDGGDTGGGNGETAGEETSSTTGGGGEDTTAGSDTGGGTTAGDTTSTTGGGSNQTTGVGNQQDGSLMNVTIDRIVLFTSTFKGDPISTDKSATETDYVVKTIPMVLTDDAALLPKIDPAFPLPRTKVEALKSYITHETYISSTEDASGSYNPQTGHITGLNAPIRIQSGDPLDENDTYGFAADFKVQLTTKSVSANDFDLGKLKAAGFSDAGGGNVKGSALKLDSQGKLKVTLIGRAPFSNSSGHGTVADSLKNIKGMVMIQATVTPANP